MKSPSPPKQINGRTGIIRTPPERHKRVPPTEAVRHEAPAFNARSRTESVSSAASTSKAYESDTTIEGGRSVRKRRKPAAFDDYVEFDKAFSRTPKREKHVENPSLPAVPIEPAAIVSSLADSTTSNGASPEPALISSIAEPMMSPQVRVQEHNEPPVVEVYVDVTEEVVQEPPPQVSKRMSILRRSGAPPHSAPIEPAPPPRAAPLLVAGPPRSNAPPPKSAAFILQTSVKQSNARQRPRPVIPPAQKPPFQAPKHMSAPLGPRESFNAFRSPSPQTFRGLLRDSPSPFGSRYSPFRGRAESGVRQMVSGRNPLLSENIPSTSRDDQFATPLPPEEDRFETARDEGFLATEKTCIEFNGQNVVLEPVLVNAGDGVREMYAMTDEMGNMVGFGIFNEMGEFVHEINPDTDTIRVIETEESIENRDVESFLEDVADENEPVPASLTFEDDEAKIREVPPIGDPEKPTSNMEPAMDDDDDQEDEGPPTLEPEVNDHEQEPVPAFIENDGAMYDDEAMIEEAEYMDAEGGTFLDEANGMQEVRTVEFNFLDNKNICCGLCGEIVPYEQLMSDHLPNAHPEVLGETATGLEEIPYDQWLRDKLTLEKRAMETGFRTSTFPSTSKEAATHVYNPAYMRATRKVSQVRVCPAEMSLAQLEECLLKKMVEKLGRRVKVSLVDKLHAKCGECGSVLSLNKKFEIMHLVRHFNAWHPTSHRCAGTWANKVPQPGLGKPLNLHDFAVVDPSIDAHDGLQCIWCGMFMTKKSLAMHYHEVHSEEIEVPSCRLCIEELVINARLVEQFGEPFEVTLPDEKHLYSRKLGIKVASEEKLQKAIEKRLTNPQGPVIESDDEAERDDDRKPASNSRMQYGRRNKPKRNFVMPAYRQRAPQDSEYVEALSDTQWRCKKCSFVIMAAVMSAGCITHYKKCHPELHDKVRYELCKVRLEYVSDGCMEFVHASLIECIICQISFALHKPYNMCRAIRHLQKKHPEMMPESQEGTEAGYSHETVDTGQRDDADIKMRPRMRGADLLPGQPIDLSSEEMMRFREAYKHVHFDEVRMLTQPDGEPVYLLVNQGQVVDERSGGSLQGSRAVSIEAEYADGYEDANGEYMEGAPPLIVELDAEEYYDDETAPIPREDGSLFRRFYEPDRYEEMQRNNTLRPEPPGYERRALQFEDYRVLEYFVPVGLYDDEVLMQEGIMAGELVDEGEEAHIVHQHVHGDVAGPHDVDQLGEEGHVLQEVIQEEALELMDPEENEVIPGEEPLVQQIAPQHDEDDEGLAMIDGMPIHEHE